MGFKKISPTYLIIGDVGFLHHVATYPKNPFLSCPTRSNYQGGKNHERAKIELDGRKTAGKDGEALVGQIRERGVAVAGVACVLYISLVQHQRGNIVNPLTERDTGVTDCCVVHNLHTPRRRLVSDRFHRLTGLKGSAFSPKTDAVFTSWSEAYFRRITG